MQATLSTDTIERSRALRAAGRPADAVRLLLPQIDEHLADAVFWNELGAAALALGSLEQAGNAYHRALQLAPDDRDALIGGGLVLQGRGLHADAREVWARAAATHAADPVPSSLLGVNLMRYGDMEAAEGWFRDALARSPGHADALAGLGSILERSGRPEEGAALLTPVVAGERPHGAVAAIAARCLLSAGHAEDALAVVTRALAAGPDPNRTVQLEHVHGDVLDRLGRHDDAFAAYARANGLRSARFDGRGHLAAARAMAAIFSPPTLAALPRGRDASVRSLLVVGVPRSGTSLMERMLARHPGIIGAGELDTWRLAAVDLAQRWGLPTGDVWYHHLDRLSGVLLDELGATYLAELDRHDPTGRAVVVDKMPHNVFQAPLAALALPGTVIVHAVRDAVDTGWSCFRQNFTDGLAWSTSLEDIGLYIRAERELMAHWKQALDVPVITVRYEELTADPRTALAPVLSALGLVWHDAMAGFHEQQDYLATASYRQVRRPLYRTSVGRAEAYAPHLAPLRGLLEAFGPEPA